MFGFKKKETPAVENVYAKTESTGPSIRNCIKCGARCSRNTSGVFHCIFCGVDFTDEEAEAIAKRRAAMQSSQPNRQYSTAQAFSTVAQTPTSPQNDNAASNTEIKANSVLVNEANSENVYADNRNGVVEIITNCGRASGFIISKKGFVITNAHAVIGIDGNTVDEIWVKYKDVSIGAKLIAIGNTDTNDSNNVDLALLKMDSVPEDAISLKIGVSANVKIGQHIYYIGNSKGEGLCMTAGIVSDNCRKVDARYYIMTDAATNPGNSGGPLFDDNGNVIGVHVSARIEAVGMKYAIPADTLRLFLNTVEDMAGIPHNTVADNLGQISPTSTENISAGVVLTLVLSGITLLVKNIEFVKEIFDTVK